MEFDKDWLNNRFKEFKEINHLLTKGCKEIPEDKGVYVVVRESISEPLFNEFNQYHLKKKLDYSKEHLIKLWVGLMNHYVLYIGKANGKKGLKKRINDYIRFGRKVQERTNQNNVCHRGGRAIWQLSDYKELKIFWKKSENPRKEEKELINKFKEQNNGNRPFANRSD
jgi:hypothetical protein